MSEYWRYGFVSNLDDNLFHIAEIYFKNDKVIFYMPIGLGEMLRNLLRLIRDLRSQERNKFRIFYLDKRFYVGDLKHTYCKNCGKKRLFMKSGFGTPHSFIGNGRYECRTCGMIL